MDASQSNLLPAGYAVEVDSVGKDEWHAVLDLFADANLYQSWSYESARGGAKGMSRLLLRRGGEIVAAAQVKVVKVPLLKLGVAYVRWGPMWRVRGREADPQVLSVALDAIRHEYAGRRGLAVRILPYLFSDESDAFHPRLEAGRYARHSAQAPQRTLVMSIEPDLKDVRARFDQKWRNCLNRAEKNELVLEEGTGDELFERFIGIYDQMHVRKGFVAGSDVNEFRAIQRDLPERHRMRVFLATSAQGQLAAGLVCSRIGDFGVYLHGATGDAGKPTNASYLLQWRAIGWLKSQGATSYNLHGINPVTNPGVYHFKAGLSGRNGRDVHYLGAYECSGAGSSQALVGMAESLRRAWHQGRTAVGRRLQAGASQRSTG